ncbi:MAG: DUF1015 family protein [Saprospiraceae bacterium]
MSTFVPFRAYRPIKEKAREVASRPYDVLNREEAKQESIGNPSSFYHVIKPEIDFPESQNPYAPVIYQRGKENFDRLVQDGVLIQDSREQFYVYQLTMNGHQQTGLVGCCSIEDYFRNVIRKHELTRPDKEEDRKNHIRASKLHYEPVLFSYPQVEAIDEVVAAVKTAKPEYDFTTDDGIGHKLWIIEDKAIIHHITRLFEQKVPTIYIADGHHRTSAGALVGKELSNGHLNGSRTSYFLAVLFPDNQLKIQDYNRVIKDLNGHTPQSFLQEISIRFDLEEKDEPYRPETLHTFGMYLNGQWYKLTAKPGTYDSTPIGQLDVTILTEQILRPVLDITDQRTDKRIEFVGGIRGLLELQKRVDSGEMAVAFSMYPVSMQQMINIADHNLIMPPKVTWFEPKLRSGLFIYSLEEG